MLGQHPHFVTLSPSANPSPPNTHALSHTSLAYSAQARLRAQDLHQPSKSRTCRPDTSPLGPQLHQRRRLCADTAARGPRAAGRPGWEKLTPREGRGGQAEGFPGGGLTHLGEGRGRAAARRAAAGRGADPASLRAAAAAAAAARDRGSRTPPPGPRRAPAPTPVIGPADPGAPEPRGAGRRAAAPRAGGRAGSAWLARVGRAGAGATSRPDARGRGGAARPLLLPLRAPGACPRAALPAARRAHRASEGMCGGRGWSCRRRGACRS